MASKNTTNLLLVNLNVKFTAFEYVYVTALVLFAICVVLCIACSIFGVISWIVLPRWRKFQNYVFINFFFVCAATMTCYFVVSNVPSRTETHCIVIIFAFVLSRIVLCHWMVVTTVMFYMDIVKVFNINIKHRYLIVNVYAWLLPVIEVSILFSVSIPLKIESECIEIFTCAVLFLNLLGTGGLYLRVLYTLINIALRCMECKKALCQKIMLCTAACITSGISTFMPVVMAEIVFKNDYVAINSICIVTLLHIIVIVLFFSCMKGHRVLWAEYWRRRRRSILVDDIVP